MGAILAFVTMEVIAPSASMGATIAEGTWIEAAIEQINLWKELIGEFAGVDMERCLIFNQRYPWIISWQRYCEFPSLKSHRASDEHSPESPPESPDLIDR